MLQERDRLLEERTADAYAVPTILAAVSLGHFCQKILHANIWTNRFFGSFNLLVTAVCILLQTRTATL